MRLRRLATQGFRNLAPGELWTDRRFVVLYGDNGQGKTNTLEAVYALATLKPLRGRSSRDLITWDADEGAVAGTVASDLGEHRLKVSWGSGRKVSLDGAPVERLVDYFGTIRAIAFTPADGAVVSDTPRRRRDWLDRAVFTADAIHLDRVRSLRRILDQKAAALRQPDSGVLSVLNDQLAGVAGPLVQARAELLAELEPHVARVYGLLAGAPVPVRLRMVTACQGSDAAVRSAAIREVLERSVDAEVRRGHPLQGPQRDEVVVELDGRPARYWASQGQVRSLVLALKLAELVAARARGDAPLFLLDDLSSELDRARTRRLVELLAAQGTQVLVSTTDPSHIEGLPPEDTARVQVVGGRFEPA